MEFPFYVLHTKDTNIFMGWSLLPSLCWALWLLADD